MNMQTKVSCICAKCPDTGCQCGRQTQAAAAYCACGPKCGCESAEQGCVCS